ncbi:MAG: pyruvate carboxylase subunit B [Candidatus Cloacimonetes bacterium]|nr:pyruvate carboxylase subunit B [Candidatus Cloacimonadota bacterium]MBT6993637.1 pyruvate carboxylase subunit B [Candidatus Cloacimonadota bacterium]MBT7470092.1 pyruvate carboxylase subunit B [Candidatus Cloacimonadota bacterium]
MDNHGILEMTKMNYDTNRPNAKNPIKIQDVSLRDGHQSIFATRGRTEDMIPVAKMLDEVGFYSLEAWGGATFDVMHRFLNEDPWERIRTLKKHITKTPLSMLLRGQNLVGYRNYADDVVEAFVQRACDNGIDIFRIFDALNDFRNFETAVKIVKKNGKHFQGTICYSLTEPRMGGETYNIDYYLEKAKQLEKMGADSICIKDMAGLIAPYDAYNLIVALKKQTDIPLHLHTHFTSGMADLTLLKAIEAGVDIIDTCMSPYAYRTSHPAVEPLVISLLGTNRDSGFDINKLAEISKKMEEVIPKYKHLLDDTKNAIIDINVILHQTPGGMLSNLVNQLRQMDALDKLNDVFEALPKVRKELGQVPLVTPTSQIVGTQTVNNVLFDEDESYTNITEQVKDLCFGLYGKTTLPIDEAVQKKALQNYPRGEKPISVRPGDTLKAEMPQVHADFKDLAKDMDDEVLCALYPVTGKRFLKWKYGLAEVPADVKPKTMTEVEATNELVQKALSGKLTDKTDAPDKPANAQAFDVFVDGEYFKVEVADSVSRQKSGKKKKAKKAEVVSGNDIVAPIPGMIVEFKKKVGDEVKVGETIVVLEAMKMFNNLDAKVDGVIKEIKFDTGDSVAKGDVIVEIG